MAMVRKQNPRVEYSMMQRFTRDDVGTNLIVQDFVSAIKRFQKNGPIHVWYGNGYEQLRPEAEFAKTMRELQKGADFICFRGLYRRFSPSKDKPRPFFVIEK